MFDIAFVNFDKHFIMKKCVSGKLLLVMAYIRLFASYSGKVLLCVDYLASALGYIPNRKAGKINENIIEALEWLKEQQYINYSVDLKEGRNNSKCFVCNINKDKNIFDMVDDTGKIKSFVQLTECEFEKIVNSTYKRKDWLISVFLHMKKRICLNGLSVDSAYCFASLEKIASDANRNVSISKSSVANVIDELVELELLFEHITGSYIDCRGKMKQAVNFYAIEEQQMNHDECDNIIKTYIEEQEGIEIKTFIK